MKTFIPLTAVLLNLVACSSAAYMTFWLAAVNESWIHTEYANRSSNPFIDANYTYVEAKNSYFWLGHRVQAEQNHPPAKTTDNIRAANAIKHTTFTQHEYTNSSRVTMATAFPQYVYIDGDGAVRFTEANATGTPPGTTVDGWLTSWASLPIKFVNAPTWIWDQLKAPGPHGVPQEWLACSPLTTALASLDSTTLATVESSSNSGLFNNDQDLLQVYVNVNGTDNFGAGKGCRPFSAAMLADYVNDTFIGQTEYTKRAARARSVTLPGRI